VGCASPWQNYQQAIRCHLDNKGKECDALYKDAIEGDPKMVGVHSSYGTHLLLQGRRPEAEAEFQLEKQNFPKESSRPITALVDPNAIAASNPSGHSTDTSSRKKDSHAK
jgi:hypothetical protein